MPTKGEGQRGVRKSTCTLAQSIPQRLFHDHISILPFRILSSSLYSPSRSSFTMSWHTPQDVRFNRFLMVYSVLATLFCFHFIYLTKLGTGSCAKLAPEPFLDDYDTPVVSTNISSLAVSNSFPRKIWQTAKTSAAGLGENERKSIQTWITKNQKHRYEVMTKHSAETYIYEHYMDKPEIAETFLDLQDNMMRADLAKYLTLSAEGGVYCDLDTVLKQPIDTWVPEEFKDTANLVVGVEYDVLDGNRWADWTLDLQFASWAILAKPHHQAFDIALHSGVTRLKKIGAEQSKTVGDMHASYKEVLDSTGPALFTRSVMETIALQTQTDFTWKNISGMKEPRLYGDVLILPINAFGSGQAHSNSGPEDGADVLVRHLFAGSWKGDHPFKEEAEKDAKKKGN